MGRGFRSPSDSCPRAHSAAFLTSAPTSKTLNISSKARPKSVDGCPPSRAVPKVGFRPVVRATRLAKRNAIVRAYWIGARPVLLQKIASWLFSSRSLNSSAATKSKSNDATTVLTPTLEAFEHVRSKTVSNLSVRQLLRTLASSDFRTFLIESCSGPPLVDAPFRISAMRGFALSKAELTVRFSCKNSALES